MVGSAISASGQLLFLTVQLGATLGLLLFEPLAMVIGGHLLPADKAAQLGGNGLRLLALGLGALAGLRGRQQGGSVWSRQLAGAHGVFQCQAAALRVVAQ